MVNNIRQIVENSYFFLNLEIQTLEVAQLDEFYGKGGREGGWKLLKILFYIFYLTVKLLKEIN